MSTASWEWSCSASGFKCRCGLAGEPPDEEVAMAAVRSPAITVAGHVVRNPADAIADYLERYGGTVTHYDLRAGTFAQIDHDLIRATRSPWMGSRISMKEAAWLIGRGATAPWAAIPLDAQLKDADPLAVDGLYDRAALLWEHFWGARPGGVSTAKISKVIYLMRPGLFPILCRSKPLDDSVTCGFLTCSRSRRHQGRRRNSTSSSPSASSLAIMPYTAAWSWRKPVSRVSSPRVRAAKAGNARSIFAPRWPRTRIS
jgi:hypothetical protein